MKKTLAILCALLIALSCLALAGCGESKEVPADSPFIGKWEAVRAEMLGEATDMSEILEGGDWFFTLNADGTCVESSGEESEPGTWWATKDGIKLKIDGGKSTLKFFLDGENMVTKTLGVSVFFEKRTAVDEIVDDASALVDDAAQVISDAVSDIVA